MKLLFVLIGFALVVVLGIAIYLAASGYLASRSSESFPGNGLQAIETVENSLFSEVREFHGGGDMAASSAGETSVARKYWRCAGPISQGLGDGTPGSDRRVLLVEALRRLSSSAAALGFGTLDRSFDIYSHGQRDSKVSSFTVRYRTRRDSREADLRGDHRFVSANLFMVHRANPAAWIGWTLWLDTESGELRLSRRSFAWHPIRFNDNGWSVGDLTLDATAFRP